MPSEAEFRKQLKSAFIETDADKSGTISHSELKNALKKAGMAPTDKDIRLIIKEADRDNSGTLNFQEFSDAIIGLSMRVLAMQLRSMFLAIDSDKSGFITSDELRKLIRDSGHKQVTDKQVETLIKDCDDNGDGKISFEEFVNNMCG